MQLILLGNGHQPRAGLADVAEPQTNTKMFGPSNRWLNRQALRCLLAICLVLPAPLLWAAPQGQTLTPVAQEISAIIAAKQHPFLVPADFANRAEDLDALYKMVNYQPLWIGVGLPTKNVNDVLELLDNASANGLQKSHYDADTLQKKIPTFTPEGNSDAEVAKYDTALSLALLRFLHDLHYGRVSPQVINFNLKLRDKKVVDLPALIKAGIEQQTVNLLPGMVEPQLKQYQMLKAALARYQELAHQLKPFSMTFKKPIHPGENIADLHALQEYLAGLGDMAPMGGDGKSTHYGDATVAGIKRFQREHGLSGDGVIGKTTVEEINTGLPKRVVQIELAMERLRWLPELSSDPSIIVNIPAFQLWALNDIDDLKSNIIQMRVVVGKAMKTQTPVLMADMSFIDFSPYWNVPYNIVKNEILPKLGGGPGYLAKENMELVSKSGVVGFSEATLAQLKQGTVRVRQKPGKKNALGRVKFLFPNKDDVYLHDTPAEALFSRSRRDFSHGCVRVDDPQGLAEFALRNQKGWDKARIQQAMSSPKMQRVILSKPIPVLFFYTTAFFNENDELVFYADIYDHDTVLREALKNPGELSDQALFVQQAPADAPKAKAAAQDQDQSALPTDEMLKTVDVK